MPKLVLLDDNGSVAQVFEENITGQQFVEITEDYYRLLRLEQSGTFNNKVALENEQKLHLILKLLQDKGAFKNNQFSLYPTLKPYFDDFINEYELRKKLDGKLRNFVREKKGLFFQNVRTMFLKFLAWGAKKLGKKLTE